MDNKDIQKEETIKKAEEKESSFASFIREELAGWKKFNLIWLIFATAVILGNF